jgi:hypothetical protein
MTTKPKNIKKNVSELNDINNLNFSVYVDNQTKYTPPTEDFLQHHIHKIYPKLIDEWVDSDVVANCQNCSSSFSFINRKHHCRACGGVYCYNCCNKYIKLPEHLLDIPKQKVIWSSVFKNVIKKITSKDKQNKDLVCNECSTKINNLIEIEYIINICEFLSLPDLYTTMFVNKKWYNASIHWLSKFRNIQYKSNDYLYTKWETNMVWINRNYLIGHNGWFTILLKCCFLNSINYKPYKKYLFIDYGNKEGYHDNNYISIMSEIIKNYNNKKCVSCWNLMCSRKCNLEINTIDILSIIQYLFKFQGYNFKFWRNQEYQDFIFLLMQTFIKKNNNSTNYYAYLIPFLTISIRLLINNITKFSSSYIHSLFDLIIENENINIKNAQLIYLTFEYNYLNTISSKNDDVNKTNICNVIQSYLKNKLNTNLKSLLSKTITFFNKLSLETNPNKYDKQLYNKMLPIIYPIDTNYIITDIIDVSQLNSSSKPLLITVNIQKNSSNIKIEKKFLLKKDPHLRKENIVSLLIILLQKKLVEQMKRGRIENFETIPTYKVIMISHNLGVIEYLDNCLTLKNIAVKNYTLQNYILENNKDNKIGIIKERFAKTLAISSCLSYVLGLGDRHASNIMVSNSGHIVHIDYGYILENPLHSSIVNSPVIRISNEMIDFLGGWNSEYYQIFKNYITKVFDLIRLYSDLIFSYYDILVQEGIMDKETTKKRLNDRFMNGMTFRDVEIVLLDVIEKSTKSYSGTFIDFCNEYSNRIKKLL